jgi:hypothetical protein
MEREPCTRRTALKHIALLMASTAGQEFLSGWLPSSSVLAGNAESMEGMHHPGAEEAPTAPYTPKFFKPEEFSNLEILTEMIIPEDDKPGAKAARVADYIDFVVFSAAEFEPGMQKEWAEGLAMLDRLCKQQFGHSFAKISDGQRHSLLTAMSLPETDPQAKHPGFAFFRLLKESTVEAFYSSRVGLMEALEYKGLTYLKSFPGCTHPEHLG